jgi:chromosome partitioning protein
MTKIISLINHKGGVGKTTTTLNLGAALAGLGQQVLLVDNDPQANLTQAFKVKNPSQTIYDAVVNQAKIEPLALKKNLAIIPCDLQFSKAEFELQSDQVNGYFRLKDTLENIVGYDYILIDCPPSLGILTMNAMIASQSILIVVESEYFSLSGLQNIIDLVNTVKKRLNPSIKIEGLLLTKLNNTVFKKNIAETVRQAYSGKVFNTYIRQNVALSESPAMGKDIFEHNPDSAGAQDYLDLAKEILNNNGKKI